MKVLVIGCGSIGRRHITNLLAMEKITQVLVCTKNEQCSESFLTNSKIELITDLRNLDLPPRHGRTGASGGNIDFAIIANETHKHIDTAIYLAERGIHVFIEKPLSHDLEKVNLLRDIAEQQGVAISIAYNLRFLGAMHYIKEALVQHRIGNPYFAQIEVGQYLPSWRSASDYRKSYSASSLKGGGVALDLSHEIDYMCYLFGKPCCWKVMKSKASALEIESEDLFEGIYQYDSGFTCTVHLDYLQSAPKRQIRILGSEGSLVGDLIHKNIRIGMNGRKETFIDDERMFDIDKTYLDEVRAFIAVLEKKAEVSVTLEDGINVLRLLEDNHDRQ
jgi:predicted dehydrogenase